MDPAPLNSSSDSGRPAAVQKHLDLIGSQLAKPRRSACKAIILGAFNRVGRDPRRNSVLSKEAELMACQVELAGIVGGLEVADRLAPQLQDISVKIDRILTLVPTEVAGKIHAEQLSPMKKLLAVFKHPLLAAFLPITAILVVIPSTCSANRKAAEIVERTRNSLRENIERGDAATSTAIAATNKHLANLTRATIPDQITYKESGGKYYALLPDGRWKPVTFRKATISNPTE